MGQTEAQAEGTEGSPLETRASKASFTPRRWYPRRGSVVEPRFLTGYPVPTQAWGGTGGPRRDAKQLTQSRATFQPKVPEGSSRPPPTGGQKSRMGLESHLGPVATRRPRKQGILAAGDETPGIGCGIVRAKSAHKQTYSAGQNRRRESSKPAPRSVV